MKKLFTLGLIIFLLILLSLSFFWIYEARNVVGNAQGFGGTFSPENTYTFITPLTAKASCQGGLPVQKIRLFTYVLDTYGKGVPGKRVTLPDNPGLQYEYAQGLTDTFGKAVINIGSCMPGTYTIQATVDGITLPQSVTITFN